MVQLDPDRAGGDLLRLHPRQIAIDDRTQNIFVADFRIQVFDGEGNHLYQIQHLHFLLE